MKFTFQILRNKHVRQEEIEKLRAEVGWDTMKGKYNRILKKVYTYYSVRKNKNLIGFLSVLSDGTGDAFLLDLMVHPDFRGKGVGSGLIKKAVMDLKREGIKSIQVTFCRDLESFYKKFGFHIIRAGIIDNDNMNVYF